MNNKLKGRRNFLQKSLLAGSSLFILPSVVNASAKEESIKTSNPQIKDLKLGIAGYSFVKFNLDQSLAMMQRMDVRYLCIKDFHLPLDSTEAEIDAFHKKLAASNVKGYAVGPLYMKTKEDIDRAFEYCKRVSVDLIIGIPEVKDLAYVAEKAKSYNVRFAIHNHGPEDKVYPNATVIWDLIKDLDKNLGLCFDMGHNMRDGQDPIKDLIRYKGRIFDIHLKNVTAANAKGTTCELGRGVIDIPAFVSALGKIKYSGFSSLEFEKDMQDPLAGLAESVGYFRGVVQTIS